MACHSLKCVIESKLEQKLTVNKQNWDFREPIMRDTSSDCVLLLYTAQGHVGTSSRPTVTTLKFNNPNLLSRKNNPNGFTVKV